MQRLYSFFLTLLTPLLLLRLFYRGLKNWAYWQRWSERFGWVPYHSQPVIWIHAVSVGEVQAALPLIRHYQQLPNAAPLLVTTTTPTGSCHLQRTCSGLYHYYCPYDLPGSVRRFIRRVKPKMLIILETELWPNLYAQCQQQDIPIILANARLSPRSFQRYQWIKPLITPALQAITVLAAQSQADHDRFLGLGAPAERLTVIGNLKFDLVLDPVMVAQGQQLRQALGVDRPIWIAASTHEGEERLILDVFARIKQDNPDCAVMIAPRHPERFNRVWQLCQQTPYICGRRTQHLPTNTTDIYLADTLGELIVFYAAADIAVVGGSFVAIGGHNPLEPAALGLPIISGPYRFNFQSVYALLAEQQAVCLLEHADELYPQLQDLWQHPDRRQLFGQRAQHTLAQHRGALTRLLALIQPHC